MGNVIPLFGVRICAGFPSPAGDFIETRLNLQDLLVKNPVSTYILKVSGDSMTGVGIFPGDLVVVDASLEAQPGNIVVAVVDGDLTIKRLDKLRQRFYLVPENENYKSIEIKDAMDLTIWGVVKNSIRFY